MEFICRRDGTGIRTCLRDCNISTTACLPWIQKTRLTSTRIVRTVFRWDGSEVMSAFGKVDLKHNIVKRWRWIHVIHLSGYLTGIGWRTIRKSFLTGTSWRLIAWTRSTVLMLLTSTTCWTWLRETTRNGCTETQNASSMASFSLMTGKCGSMWIELNTTESLTGSRIESTWTKSVSEIRSCMIYRRRRLRVFRPVKHERSLHSLLFWSLYQWAAVAERIMRRTSKPFHAGSAPVSGANRWNDDWVWLKVTPC